MVRERGPYYRVMKRRAERITLASLMAVLLGGVAGCPPSGPGLGPIEAPLPIDMVVARVNENNLKMDFLLWGRIRSATGRWRRGPEESAPSTSFDMNGVLLYRKPRDLYLRLEHRLGGKLEAGSNHREFWVWERLQDNCYWWGEHRWLRDGSDANLPVRPDVLLDVLGVGNLPTNTTGSRGPVLWVREEEYQLLFLEIDPTGQSYIARVMDIGRRPPYLIDSIHYFEPDGRPVMQVLLSDYQPIEGSEVVAPRRIEMKSLENDNHMLLQFATMKRYENPEAERFFTSPMQRGDRNLSRTRRVDGWRPPLVPVTRPATRPGTGPAAEPSSSSPATEPDTVAE